MVMVMVMVVVRGVNMVEVVVRISGGSLITVPEERVVVVTRRHWRTLALGLGLFGTGRDGGNGWQIGRAHV